MVRGSIIKSYYKQFQGIFMTYLYTLYGLALAVPFPCPMLTPAPVGTVSDVTVVEGSVPYRLATPQAEFGNWQATPGSFLLRGGHRSGRFLVEDGQRVTLQRNPAAEVERLCANLTTGVISALLSQRGQVVLHASVVMTPRGAVAISGESGAGKSTTQAALLARGCQMVTDDVTILKWENGGQVKVLPGFSNICLCEDAAIKMGLDVANLEPNPFRRMKVVVPIAHDRMIREPVALKELYQLNRHPGKGLNVICLSGAEKFHRMQECLSGPQFPEKHPGQFATIRALAEQVKMVAIERPAHGCSVARVAETILHG
jgi:hypothetical protein